jgi:hypothetical protein
MQGQPAGSPLRGVGVFQSQPVCPPPVMAFWIPIHLGFGMALDSETLKGVSLPNPSNGFLASKSH